MDDIQTLTKSDITEKQPNNTEVRFSLGKNIYDIAPIQLNAKNFDAFESKVLSTVSNAKGEKFICAPLAIGLHPDQDKYKGENNWRRASSVQPRNYISFDFDGFCSSEMADTIFDYLGRYRGFGYYTSSSTPLAPRARVILSLDRNATRDECMLVNGGIQADIELFFGTDAAKFDGTVYRGEQPVFTPVGNAINFSLEGKAVEVDTVLKRVPSSNEKKVIDHENDLGVFKREPYPFTQQNAENFLDAAWAVYPNGLPDGESFYDFGAACAELNVVQHWPEIEARKVLDEIASKPEGANQSGNNTDWANYIKGTRNRVANGELVAGHRSVFKKARDNGWKPKSETTKTVVADRYSLIRLGSKVGIIDNLQAAKASTINPLSVYSRDDGGLLIKRLIKATNTSADANKAFNEWLLSPDTTTYEGIELNPNVTTARCLNLWHGLSVTPKQGEYGLIDKFILEVICSESKEIFIYIWNWLAHMVQRPAEKPGISLILIGGQGIGKGTFAVKLFGGLFADHFLHLQTAAAITGDFNQSLESSFNLFVDEAVVNNDRKAANVLKAIETEHRLHVNPKFQASRQIESYHRIIYASNNEHAAYVEFDDRRKVALHVSSAHKGDWDYWDRLDKQIDNGGLEAFAHALLNTDISQFQVRNKPNTGELLKQKIASLDDFSRWWFDRLSMGAQTKFTNDWENFASTASLHGDYLDFHKLQNVRGKTPSIQEFVDKLKLICPKVTPTQQGSGHSRKRGFTFPPLPDARVAFEKRLGGSISWD
ncbi:MAG: DUF5906 domain-containing protein [Methylotenera sp.]|uniref:primase-helicase family protein n=1 Tax=Methylotenera sp. TaxID=2051956 RepID=UPI002487163C|nr:primase-helicase family protein [Methylotenera sp.]MDI1309398.1 DUF5906 domain-containing protein [Methylotenera sp.]